ncbi:MAG: Proton glutamate symport protein [Candidatus Anoxychlamydiales bacterium]|uniref:Amino acid transporter n=1 Tax=marine sediment metagenome TaxID=412755 RepID=A0A0F9MQL1_9ZZZZ|nr:Proton glutamate symport protein [Candidatus Anoxychlamydiales bacterium]
MKKILFSNISILIAIALGLFFGFLKNDFIYQVASFITTIFIKLLKLIGVPIVFLSLVSNIAGMKSFKEMKILGRKIFSYAVITTIIAATIALILFLIIKPSHVGSLQATDIEHTGSYLSFLIDAIPDNFFKAFVSNNVIAVAFLGILMGLSILFLPTENKKTLHHFFSSFFLLFLKITKLIIALMPIGIMGFVCIFIKEISQNTENLKDLILYTTTVVTANLVQGFLILPLFLKLKKISPYNTFKNMSPALITAFFTKSSNAALPISIKCSEEKLKISSKVANVTHSLCSVINMNACAGFILITVLFVSKSYGMSFSIYQMVMWIFLATIAAIGNAGVPMGCYFLTTAFLTSMNVPLYLMGLILPIYTIIDMLESALNVWSNSCICQVVDKEIKEPISEVIKT